MARLWALRHAPTHFAMPDATTSTGSPGAGEPPLSVVIVSYNTVALLARCVRSVLTDAPPGTEIYVVDNASRDGSADMVRRAFPAVRLIANEHNSGFAAAANQALRSTGARYITLLNSDAEIRRGSLPRLVAFLDDRPAVGVAGARLIYGDGQFQHSAFRFPTLLMALVEFFPLNHRLVDSRVNGRFPAAAYSRVFAIDHPLGACMTVRRDALQEVGLLDESFFLYCEEVDWSWRFKQAGWQVVHCPDVLVIHHEAQSTRQRRGEMLVQLYRSRYRLYSKHRAGWRQQGLRWLVRLGAVTKVATSLLPTIGASTTEQRQQSRAEAAAYREVLRL
ncbi:MAG: glycosyl transferase [Dehalococcoidia bacterium]|nr:glycosyl transferase [Dehalococcoidia bacterium]